MREGAARREIRLYQVKTTEGVPSEISLHRGGRHNQRRRIDLPPSGNVRIVNPLRHSRHQVRPEGIGAETDAALDCNIDWKLGLCGDNTV